MYTPGAFGKKINISVKTLQRWDRQGILRAKRTITNQRYYTEEDLAAVLQLDLGLQPRKTVVYCRVSSQNQRPDLENQKRILEEYCEQEQIKVDEWITEIGGGMNFKRKHFLKLVDAIIAGEVECLVLAHKDRLVRFGSSLLVHLCQTHQCKLVVMDARQLSPEQELTQDLITITHCFSSRLYRLRNYRKALEAAIKDEKGASGETPPNP